MIPLILGVILVVLLGKFIDYLGKDSIGEFLWEGFTKVSPTSQARTLRQSQRKAIDLYTERSNTSSKDEFAKWAKLDREYIKTKNHIDELNRNINGQKSTFKKAIKAGIFLATTGAKMYIRVKYRKQAVFWLPPGMFPRFVQWFLSFSSAPMGSVSVSIWLMVVNSAINTLTSTYNNLTEYSKHIPETKAKAKQAPITVEQKKD